MRARQDSRICGFSFCFGDYVQKTGFVQHAGRFCLRRSSVSKAGKRGAECNVRRASSLDPSIDGCCRRTAAASPPLTETAAERLKVIERLESEVGRLTQSSRTEWAP